ncbi:MAG: DUF4287 domain-containing protein [Cyclobacteriaceae bacterium]|nr:MAG: DUF4287 domain-containing protein [Cyclobacteriaceae bacterium]
MSFQAYITNIKAKTGKSPEDFKKLAEKRGVSSIATLIRNPSYTIPINRATMCLCRS